ncbi:hypothetical protein LTR09_005720 [Extremus antarcticus]|uniref:Uncharacterized protein n=1 Tax=Extremus antarcticus TaxID=702011 RepID=A0AAJ0DMN1_9PEZI|nr:hypothetical protein LTR09_005720 [Extremus antarcticus]
MPSDESGHSSEQDDGYEDHQTVEPRPSPEPQETSLEIAIDTAPDLRLWDMLKLLARNQPMAKTSIEQFLTVPIHASTNKKRKA